MLRKARFGIAVAGLFIEGKGMAFADEKPPRAVPLRHLWIACNGLGIILFLAVASNSWIEPELADVPGASGGAAFVWAFTALPIFLVFVLLNLLVSGLVAVRLIRFRDRNAVLIAFGTLVAWALAFVFDGLQHGI